MSWDYPIVERREIGVAVERRTLKSQWAEYRWHPAAIFSELPAAAPWTELARTPDAARFYIGPATLELVPMECENYKYNLEGREALAWVILRAIEGAAGDRAVELIGATLSAGEAEALTDAGSDIVESVPLPPELEDWLAEFVAKHYVERPRHKRKRGTDVADGVVARKSSSKGTGHE